MQPGELAATPPATEDQAAIFALLADPATYGIEGPVHRIDTHGAAVFLAGTNAYKVKRAVRFPFMDFSTLAKRRAACEAEILVNRPNAPDLYLGVVPITRESGGLALGGPGEPVDYAVHMRRFDETETLDRLDPARLTPELIAKLARVIARSHRLAPARDGGAATEALERYLEQNEVAFAADPELFDSERAAQLARDARAALAAAKPLLLSRGKTGLVRRCHGDLHLRNIVLIAGEPVLFDAVEFDDGIATGDVLYDLAFVLMDLEERGLRAAANLLMNRYLWEGSEDADIEGLAALPIFLSIRSAIRAKVVAAGLVHLSGAALQRGRDEARRYFWFAEEFLRPVPAGLIAVGGLSGTGKSVLSAALAPKLGRCPGAVLLRSDIERKKLFQAAETERLPSSAYDERATQRVYDQLQKKAGLVLAAGQWALIDAVHARPAERTAIERVAQEANVPFIGLWLEVPLALRRERVAGRRNDASDADQAVVESQAAYDVGNVTWARIDMSGDLASGLEAARRWCAASAGLSGTAIEETHGGGTPSPI